MQLEQVKTLVIGAGRSGLAVARFLKTKGAAVTLTDNKDETALGGDLKILSAAGVRLSLGRYPAPDGFDLVVVSPGVPLSMAPVARARERGVPVIGELELAWRFCRAPLVAITGTNGKTTTTSLLGEIFKHAGVRTLVAGNIGNPLVAEVENFGPSDLIVAEVSSFQLETTVHFHPQVAAILNITPDHLDRHGDMAGYTAAKARIFANQGPKDCAVLNYDDPPVRELAANCPGRVIFFSRVHTLKSGVFIQGGQIMAKMNSHSTPVMPVNDLRLPGAHNLENALAAVACALERGVPERLLADTLRQFPGVPHRLEPVAEIDGVMYVNDSKGTNPDASIKALESYTQPVVLLAGGKNKGNDFTAFVQRAKEKVRAMVVLGQCAGELETAARAAGITRVLKAGDFRQAVFMARNEARPGDVVLLSPACASWDMFKSYEERGDLFREIVLSMRG
ncbi:UDP-N-acetylmuramoyl-L-alanine--D-glutamate ligase [Desulfotomaculum copahuensis]|uniref:UDP-N-acetylmuramoyl-L-alanine--D-glutamate ligase n=1 Tax=Desulfotomaculum copahuensis TaxID=1838280 RepID=UPI00098F1EA5|nr:UDP-N-acetylmuramoyl-L-alanine--D-glutamate ligase [Desulfotomaculum copahuensis]